MCCRVVVNLGQAVIEAVREARYLDRLGFKVPEVALHAALQASHFRAAVEGLTNMLAAYYKVCRAFTCPHMYYIARPPVMCLLALVIRDECYTTPKHHTA